MAAVLEQVAALGGALLSLLRQLQARRARRGVPASANVLQKPEAGMRAGMACCRAAAQNVAPYSLHTDKVGGAAG